METLKFFAMIAGFIATILGCVAMLITPVRQWLIKIFNNRKNKRKEKEEEQKLIKEIHGTLQGHIKSDVEFKEKIQEVYELQNKFSQTQLRDNITTIYYTYLDSKRLPSFVHKHLIEQKELYDEFNGNTYVQEIFDIMMTWDVYK